ncbi:MAG: lamin tail domain-containing protein [Flavobacteriales bacterium]|nr:lamin tail domain-containing protein [Flavobacteriales bacterium]
MKTGFYLIGIFFLAISIQSCKKKGCMDENALNYDSSAEKDDGSCNYPTDTGKVFIQQVIAYPDFSESVSIKNTMETTQDIGGWIIGDEENPNIFTISSSANIESGEVLSWTAVSLGITINDSKETIFLKDDSGLIIDSWEN